MREPDVVANAALVALSHEPQAGVVELSIMSGRADVLLTPGAARVLADELQAWLRVVEPDDGDHGDN